MIALEATRNYVYNGHPSDERLSKRPNPANGMDRTDDPSEILDINQTEKFSIYLETVLLSYQQTFSTEIRNLVLYLRKLRSLTPLEPLTQELKTLLRKLDNNPGVTRPNNVQFAIKKKLIQTKPKIRQLLPPNHLGQDSHQAASPQQVSPLSTPMQRPGQKRRRDLRPVRPSLRQSLNRQHTFREQQFNQAVETLVVLEQSGQHSRTLSEFTTEKF
ncbi:hypothetical protein OUZ56_025545 [Daphnia magna]|uniref:Uncharacterized protein n=1 Tax=Daphnia magna TaxID=35525 RepID=A0ABQ9ZK59_9CRUS|nr:hypothetical protein OUZ56_025545 [Daphnia magna]